MPCRGTATGSTSSAASPHAREYSCSCLLPTTTATVRTVRCRGRRCVRVGCCCCPLLLCLCRHLWTLRIRLRGLGAEQHALVGTMIDVALQHACTFFPHTVNLTPGSSDCHLANRIDAYTTYWHWPDVAYLSKRDSHTPGPRQSDASPVSKGSASRKQPRPGQCL